MSTFLATMAPAKQKNNTQIDRPLRADADRAAGLLRYKRSTNDKGLNYYLHLPPQKTEGAPVLVAVHGVSCNAKEQAEQFGRIASRFGFVVVAPHFTRSCFPAYQRLGFRDGKYISDPGGALLAVLNEVSATTGADTSRIYLFGYSGGGQYIHRFAMKYPYRVHRIVVGAPGWLTFPDATTNYPRGLLGAPGFDADRFLQIPALLLVGNLDRERDPALNTSAKLDGQQGRNRVERGKRWIGTMRRAAHLRAIPDYDFRFELLPDCAHLFIDCCQDGNLVLRSMSFFLENHASIDRTEPGQTTGCLLFSAGGD